MPRSSALLSTLTACVLTASDPIAAAQAAQPVLDAAPAAAVGWRRTALGEPRWSGYTRAVTVGTNAYLLHGRDVEVVRGDGTFEHWASALPRPVEAFSAVATVDDDKIAVVPGRGAVAFLFDPRTRTSSDLVGLTLQTGRGARIVSDARGSLLCTLGHGSNQWVRYRDGNVEPMPAVETVNMPGKYASALFRVGGKILCLGDHHVSSFDLDAGKWDGTNKLFFVLGFRPALDRGGMFCQDPVSQMVFAAHGKGSRAVGVLFPQRQFHYLRPRLPIGLHDAGETMFLTGAGAALCLHVLSLLEGALFSIPVAELAMVDRRDRSVEAGSRWQIWNLRELGAAGDLVRERDSTANTVFVDPLVYVQRKNALRSIEYYDWLHCDWKGTPEFGPNFAVKGAAICTDGRFIYVTNGYSNDFFALDLQTPAALAHADVRTRITKTSVRRLAPLHTFPAKTVNDDPPRNMTMVCHAGKVFALRDPVTRILHAYDPEQDRWEDVDLIPAALRYTDELGVDLMSAGERLLLLSADALTTWAPGVGWSEPVSMGFRYSSDGGMAIFDPVAKLIYVVLGGRSRDFAVVDPADGSNRVLVDFFPDVISVHGRRLFLTEHDGVRYFNIQRGHDSSEFWRTAISGEGRLSAK